MADDKSKKEFFNDNYTNKIIKTTDVITGIKTYIDRYYNAIFPGDSIKVTNSGTNQIPSGDGLVYTNSPISWGLSIDDFNKTLTKYLSELLKKINQEITISDVYNLIIKCLWYCCRVYFQHYYYYKNEGKERLRTHNYKPPIIDSGLFRGLDSKPHLYDRTEIGSSEDYESIVNPLISSLISGDVASLKKDKIIRASSIDDFINTLIDFNKKQEYTITYGSSSSAVNTCYSSCYDDCHSNRSRR